MGRLRRPAPPGTTRVRSLAVVVAALVLVAVWIARQRAQPVAAGFRAPDFAVTDARGETVTMADFAGKVVLLNVWATWCGPCREEMPSMQRLYDRFSPEDFEIAAISIDALPDRTDDQGNPGGDPIAFARELGLGFPVLLDPAGEIQRTYRTAAVPESFLIGRDGVIYKKVAGATEWDSPTNVELVRRLVDGRAASATGSE